MKWDMLEESKKLFPHWLDKSENSNFTKHLKILNNQQKDIRHKIKTLDWSRLINKPLQIHKTQTEPYKWKVEFEVNVPRLKKINIYKNPTIVNNKVINNYKVINGYYYQNDFYEHHNKNISSLSDEEFINNTYYKSNVELSEDYVDKIVGEEGKYYYDLKNKKYYIYKNNNYTETSEENVPQTSLIHSESFIDNYSHFFRHIIYEDNTNSINIIKFVTDEDNNQKYKTITTPNNDSNNNGKYELIINNEYPVYFNITSNKYGIVKEEEFEEINDEDIIHVKHNINLGVNEGENVSYEYYYENDDNENVIVNINSNDGKYYIFTETNLDNFSRIPLIEQEDLTPLISDDKYVLEVYTWDDYHFLKGFPEIDFIDYNNNNIIDNDERNYDNLNINIEKIGNKEYLTFRIHQYGIKLIEIFKDGKPIHIADFIIEKFGYDTKQINNNFAHIYDYKDNIYNYNDNNIYYPFEKDSINLEEVNLDVNKYVWRYEITNEDKIFVDENKTEFELNSKFDLKVTYYDSLHPYESEYDKVLRKTYVCEDSIFYHDTSLDTLGVLYNVPRHVYSQPTFDSKKEEIEFYNNTYPTFCNSLTEDDYHYQKRLEYYINNYNKIYFPCLELWKYFHIDSKLVNRKVIVAEQNYSYLRTLRANENKYINELGKNKVEAFYLNSDYETKIEETSLSKPKLKSVILPDDYLKNRNGILIDNNDNYIRDIYGTLVRVDYDYYINENNEYVIRYENASREFKWYKTEVKEDKNIITLTDSLKVVPNTRYQLRFCVKEYPEEDINLKIIYKNNNGDVREIEEYTPLREDYDENNEYNEIIYTNYNEEWGIVCEYICTNFITLSTAQNIELSLESKSEFKISDITLQRITVNHFDSEYMKTTTDYNSCVYDLYADYNEIPSNIRYDDLTIFNKLLNRSLPLTKTGYFNCVLNDTSMGNNMNLSTQTNLYLGNLLKFESGVLSANDYATMSVPKSNGFYEHEYNFNKYIKKGEYEIILKPYFNTEDNIIFDFNIDITMIVFDDKNSAIYETTIITPLDKHLKEDENGFYFKIPFKNKSDNSFKIRIYRNEPFSFKNFELNRKFPLTMEEITK